MPYFKIGRVKSIDSDNGDSLYITVTIGHKESKAICYNTFVPEILEADDVLLNITANELKLGTGGYDFVIANLSRPELSNKVNGHIIKMPYTPMQFECLSVEEQSSKYHNAFENIDSLGGMPVVVGSLHSQLAPIVATINLLSSDLKVAYIMTDGAALPISFSKTVKELSGCIEKTITCGNAFGGDIEAVNIYTALLAAKHIAHADIAIVIMGPGVKGTGTKFGFSAIEQGWILDAVNNLDGFPIYAPRIHFSDTRDRHKGVSHHSLTILGKIARTPASIVVSKTTSDMQDFIYNQLIGVIDKRKHNLHIIDGSRTKEALDNLGIKPMTMGRGYEEEKVFFETAGAAGVKAVETVMSKM